MKNVVEKVGIGAGLLVLAIAVAAFFEVRNSENNENASANKEEANNAKKDEVKKVVFIKNGKEYICYKKNGRFIPKPETV